MVIIICISFIAVATLLFWIGLFKAKDNDKVVKDIKKDNDKED